MVKFDYRAGFLLLISAFCTFSACSTLEVNEDDPAALLAEAEDDIASSRYLLASDHLRAIKNKHPYSKEAVIASLRLADVLFLQDSYIEAAAHYEAFADLHPKHEKVGYARYRVGLSYFMDIPSVRARDLTSALKAQDAFREYLDQHPNDANAAEAKAKLAEARAILAEKEMYVGNFYYKREHWEAARGRYQNVVNLYSDTPSVEKARERLAIVESKPKPAENGGE